MKACKAFADPEIRPSMVFVRRFVDGSSLRDRPVNPESPCPELLYGNGCFVL